MNTETVNSFENSSNSLSMYEESNSRLNLDNAMLMDEILSDNSDESFYDTMNGNTSIAIRQSDNILNTSEYYDSTSFFSLPDTKSHANCKNENPINVNNSQHQQDVKAEKKDNTHAPVSLKTLLRQMFDEILGKSDSAKQTNETDSTRNVDNEFLSSNNNLTDRSHNTFEKNNNSICQTKKFHNMIKISTEGVNDPSKINASPSCDTYTSNRLDSERLITILENSNESSSNSQQNESINWSGKCIGKLKNIFSWKLNNKCTNKQIFTTSEICDDISISSDTSTEIDIVNKEIFQKINNLRANDSLNVINFQFRNKIIVVESPVNSVKNEVNSAMSNPEESVCPGTFFHSSKTETKKLKDYNRIGKKIAKRRSLSMSENNTEEKKDQDSNDNKNNSKSKTPQRMDFFNRTNIRERKSVSPRIIASPIKPVTYLRKVFMDMEKKNKVQSMKQSPTHKLRQTKVPFISVTPATPEHLK